MDIEKALRVNEDWDVAQQLNGWDDKEMESDYDQVVDLLTPESIERDRSKVKITHTDNVANTYTFLRLYTELQNSQPIKQISECLSVHEMNGKRYAIEFSDGGAYAIFHYVA